MNKRQVKLLIIFGIIAVLLGIAYLTVWLYTQRDLLIYGNANVYFKIIRRRAVQLLAIVVSTGLITSSSLVFQTLTKNRILTPSVLGFDSIFLVTQTLLVSLLGVSSILISNVYVNFIISTLTMIVITIIMYQLVLKKNKNNVVLLLLMGMIISSLAGSVSNFIQVFMNPDQFQSVLSLTTVSLTNINEQLVYILVPIMVVVVVLIYRKNRIYDVMALGDDQAIGLGVEYNKETKITLVYIAIAVAISTSLIGPLTFLGLIAVNGTRELFKTTKHKVMIVASFLLGFIVLMAGQVVVELMDNRTSVSVLISLIGGSYMIYLILKENKL
ncbi:MAG: iron chelate uptake ABC transporter family permease subunit [Acholeplasma sp.]|nr:iron chelate uptake ABC transporter family permease subunit [Acholeplasma sp.]